MFTVRFDESVDPQVVNYRIIFNPNYGGPPCQVPGTVIIPINAPRKVDKPLFLKSLKSNVKSDGFRNPIILYSTTNGLLLEFGGSRLRVAKALDKRIPAIIVDYTGDYTLFEEVGPHNWKTFFRDVPEYFEFTDAGVSTHYSIEKNRRNHYDPAGLAWMADHEGGPTFIADMAEEFPWISLKS